MRHAAVRVSRRQRPHEINFGRWRLLSPATIFQTPAHGLFASFFSLPIPFFSILFTQPALMSDSIMLSGSASSESAPPPPPASSADSSLIQANDVGGADTLSTTISQLEQRLAEKGMDWADIWDTEPSSTMEDEVQVTVDGSVSSPAGLVDDERTAQDITSGIAKDLGEAGGGEYVTSTVVFQKPQRPVLFLQTIFQPPSPKPCAFASTSHWVSSPTSPPIVLPAVRQRRKRRSVPAAMRVTNMNTNAVDSPISSTRSSTMTYIELAQPPHVPLSPSTAVRKSSTESGFEIRYGNLKTRAAERWGKLAVKWRARGRVRSTEVEKTGSWKIE